MVALGRSIAVNAQPFLIKKIIDTINQTPIAHLFEKVSPLVFYYIGVGLFFVVLFRIYDLLNYTFVPKQKEFIMLKLMERMMGHSTAFYQRHFAGNLTNKVNDVCIQTPEVIKIVTDHFTTCFLTLILVIINVAAVHIHFAWALLTWLVLFMGGSLWMLFSSSHYAYKAAESRSQAVGYIVDLLMNMVSVRLFARAKHEKKLLKNVTLDVYTQERNRERFFMKLHFFQGFSFWIFEGVCFWWLLKGVCDGSITAGQFVLVFSLNLQILDQFWDLGSEIREFWEKKGYITQALKTIFGSEALSEPAHLLALEIEKGKITFEHVHFFYPGSPVLFQDKTIVIEGGQKVGLVGHSGSGKSTFISLILRLYDITSGSILIDGQDIQNVTRQSLYESISVIPQESYLFNRSIMDNIRYGRLDATDAQVYEAAYKAQAHDFIEKLPGGYQATAGERGSLLSGGQRQLISVARAILKDAPILLMDEATSNLDVITEQKLTQAFSQLMTQKTSLVIAHRLSTLKILDRILVFQQGKIVQDGTHEALIQDHEGMYFQMWSTQGTYAPTHLE